MRTLKFKFKLSAWLVVTALVMTTVAIGSAMPDGGRTPRLPAAEPTPILPTPDDVTLEAIQLRLSGLGQAQRIIDAATGGDVVQLLTYVAWTSETCPQSSDGGKDSGPLCSAVRRLPGERVDTLTIGHIAPYRAPREYVESFFEAALRTGGARLSFAAPVPGDGIVLAVTFPQVSRPVGEGPPVGAIMFELDAGDPAMITRVLFLAPTASPAAAFQEVYQWGVDDSIWYNDTQLPSPGTLNGVQLPSSH